MAPSSGSPKFYPRVGHNSSIGSQFRAALDSVLLSLSSTFQVSRRWFHWYEQSSCRNLQCFCAGRMALLLRVVPGNRSNTNHMRLPAKSAATPKLTTCSQPIWNVPREKPGDLKLQEMCLTLLVANNDQKALLPLQSAVTVAALMLSLVAKHRKPKHCLCLEKPRPPISTCEIHGTVLTHK